MIIKSIFRLLYLGEGETAVKEVVREIEPTKKPKKKRNIVIGTLLGFFAVYAVVTLISQQVQINRKQSELSQLEDKILIQEVKNGEVEKVYNSDDKENEEYIRRIAREELGYAEPDERVFINIAGE
ncbi:septum formation initiator family protein [Ruminococcus sp. zg-924]|nr:septum formation initiator family protein [Ruminococcus sp. zg-924]MCQ4114604.1 septum formation initiator family protein [Ruminococcus sp. zg-921]